MKSQVNLAKNCNKVESFSRRVKKSWNGIYDNGGNFLCKKILYLGAAGTYLPSINSKLSHDCLFQAACLHMLRQWNAETEP